MTIERKIDYPKIDVNLINLFPVPLDKSEITDASSDLDISFKFVDNEGKTVLLIEACSSNIEGDKKIKEINGCYIRKFEFVEELLYPPYDDLVLSDFIRWFVTSVKYKLKVSNDNIISEYQYVWAEEDNNIQCVIAEILGLKVLRIDEDIAIYKSGLFK